MRKKFKLISFDVDFTLTKVPIGEFLLGRYGKGSEAKYLVDLYRNGKISYEDLCIKINELLKGKSLEEIYKDLDEIPLRKNIEKTVNLFKKDGLKVIILSDVPTCITCYFKKYGIEDFLGPEVLIEGGKIGEVYYPKAKILEIEQYCKKLGIQLNECIHVGDSKRDMEVFEKVGFGIAINPKYPEVEEVADITLKSDNLLEVYKEVERKMHSKPRLILRKIKRRLYGKKW